MARQPPPEVTGFTWILGCSSDSTVHLIAAVVLIACTFWLIARRTPSPTRSLPPGPRGLPLIGDIRHVADQEWLATPRRRDEYGHTLASSPYETH